MVSRTASATTTTATIPRRGRRTKTDPAGIKLTSTRRRFIRARDGTLEQREPRGEDERNAAFTAKRTTRRDAKTQATKTRSSYEAGILVGGENIFKDNSHVVHYGEVCDSDDDDDDEGKGTSRRKRRDPLASLARKAESKSSGKKAKKQDKAREKAMRGLENLILNASGSDGMKARKKYKMKKKKKGGSDAFRLDRW